MINKKIAFTCLIAGAILLSGCGDKKKDETKKVATQEKPAAIKVTNNVVKKSTKKEVSKANGGQFYYSYNEEGKSKEAKEIEKYNKQSAKERTTIDAYLGIKNPYERIKITMMIHKLSKDYIIKCSPCHDDYANGVIGPSLLGRDRNFIYKRIIDFKTGKKKNVLMKELVMQISDKKLGQIAGEIEKFNKQIQKMRKER